MITATLNNIGSVRDYLAGLAPHADAAIRSAVAEAAERLRDAADANLSGAILKSRTGTLRNSLSVGSAPDGTDAGGSIVASAPYAAFQEYGFSGTETVRSYLRKTAKGGSATVRSFGRKIDYPAHSYLRSALAELAPDIRQTIADAVAGALAP